MANTKVKQFMTKNPVLITPDTTLKNAAIKMKKIDCGILPIGNKDKLEGIITDRDIVIRAVAEGIDLKTATVEEYMSKHTYSCNEEDSLSEAADIMGQHKVSRLVVRNAEGEISGILSLGCILRNDANASEIIEVIEQARGRKVA